jgi:hypothetical protein
MMRALTISLIRLLALTSIWIAVSSHNAGAGFITQADFTNPIIYDLSNLGPLGNYATPFIVGPFSFTSDDGQIRYASLGYSNIPGQNDHAIGDNTDLGFLDISLSPGMHKFGFLVGLGSDEPTSETITFLGTGGVLGSTSVSRSGGFQFVGFDDGTGLIAGVLINDTLANASVFAVDNLEIEAVPLPNSLSLFAPGLALIGWMAWRRRSAPV